MINYYQKKIIFFPLAVLIYTQFGAYINNTTELINKYILLRVKNNLNVIKNKKEKQKETTFLTITTYYHYYYYY